MKKYEEKRRGPGAHEPISDGADDSPRARRPAVEPAMSSETLDGQLGPDEISEPDEVVMNNEAKLHH